jgi:hypothetical protein
VCLSVNQRALDGLTKELREEENKSAALRQELQQLQAIVGAHQFNVSRHNAMLDTSEE